MFEWIKPQRPALTPEAVRAADALVRAEGLAPLMRAQDDAQATETKAVRGSSRGWLSLGTVCALQLGVAALAPVRSEAPDDQWWERSPEPDEMWHPQWDLYWGD